MLAAYSSYRYDNSCRWDRVVIDGGLRDERGELEAFVYDPSCRHSDLGGPPLAKCRVAVVGLGAPSGNTRRLAVAGGFVVVLGAVGALLGCLGRR